MVGSFPFPSGIDSLQANDGVSRAQGSMSSRAHVPRACEFDKVFLWGNIVAVHLDQNEIDIRWALVGCGPTYVTTDDNRCGYMGHSVDIYVDQWVC